MIHEKIKLFAGLPDSELTKVGGTEKPVSTDAGSGSIENEFAQTNKHTVDSGLNTLNTLKTDPALTETTDTPTKNRLGAVLKGNYAVSLVDMLLPSLLVLLFNYFNLELDKKGLKLNKDEKEALSPAVQDVLDHIELDFNNPYINLGIMLGIVYGGKLIDQIPTMKKKKSDTDTEKVGLSNKLSVVVNNEGGLKEVATDGIEELTPLQLFEKDYNELVDVTRKERRRGAGDAKDYLAKSFPEKIKAIGKKHKVPFHLIEPYLNFTHTAKRRKSNENDFNMPT